MTQSYRGPQVTAVFSHAQHFTVHRNQRTQHSNAQLKQESSKWLSTFTRTRTPTLAREENARNRKAAEKLRVQCSDSGGEATRQESAKVGAAAQM